MKVLTVCSFFYPKKLQRHKKQNHVKRFMSLKMVAACSMETSVDVYRRYVVEDHRLHFYRRENAKSGNPMYASSRARSETKFLLLQAFEC
jgi:hypothetical protein